MIKEASIEFNANSAAKRHERSLAKQTNQRSSKTLPLYKPTS